MPTVIELVALALVLLLVLPSTAWAYIDPGSGSYLLQLMIAAAVAGLYTLRKYWQRLGTAVRKLRGSPPTSGDVTPPSDRPSE